MKRKWVDRDGKVWSVRRVPRAVPESDVGGRTLLERLMGPRQADDRLSTRYVEPTDLDELSDVELQQLLHRARFSEPDS